MMSTSTLWRTISIVLLVSLLLGLVPVATNLVQAQDAPAQGLVQMDPAPAGSEPGVLQAEELVTIAATEEEKTITYRWTPENCGAWHTSSGGSRPGSYWAQNNSNMDANSVVADCHLPFNPPGDGWIAQSASTEWWTATINQDDATRKYQIESRGIVPTFTWPTHTGQEPDAYGEWHRLELYWPATIGGLRLVAFGGSADWIGFSDISLTIVYRRDAATATPTQIPPTATPTQIPPTWTPTATPSPTPTFTPSPSPTPQPTATPTNTPTPQPEPIVVCNEVLTFFDESLYDGVKSANFWDTRPMTDTVKGAYAGINVWAPEPEIAAASNGYDAPLLMEAQIPSDATEIRIEGFYRGDSETHSSSDFLSVNVQVGSQNLTNRTLLHANSLDTWNRWRPYEYAFSATGRNGQTVRLEFFAHTQEWGKSWFQLDDVKISACRTEMIQTPQLIEAGPINQVYGYSAEALAAMGMVFASHGTSAYATEFGKGLYSIEYMWKTSAMADFPAHVLGGRPFPGVVQNGQNVPFEDGMWVTTRADMSWKMAFRCVQQRCWTPEGNADLLRVLTRMRDANTFVGRDLVALERQISVLNARAALYQSLSAEQLAMLRHPIVAVWQMDESQVLRFAEKSKRGTMVVKDGYLLWKNVYAIEFPRDTPASIVNRVYRNIRQAGAPSSVKLIVGGVETHSRYWKDWLPSIGGSIAAIRTFGGTVLTWTVHWGQSLARPVGVGLTELGTAGIIETFIAANVIVGASDAAYDLYKWGQMETWQTNVRAGDFAMGNNMLTQIYMPSTLEWRSSPVTNQASPVVVEIPQHGVPYTGRGTPGYMSIPASQSFIWMRVKEVRGSSLVLELLDEPQPRQFVVRREVELSREFVDGTQLTYWIEDENAGMMSMTFDVRLWNYEGGTADIEVRWAQTRAPEDYGCREGWRPSLEESCLYEVALPLVLK